MRNGINSKQIINDRLTYNSDHIIHTNIGIIINVNDLNILSKGRDQKNGEKETQSNYILLKNPHQTELHRLKVKG